MMQLVLSKDDESVDVKLNVTEMELDKFYSGNMSRANSTYTYYFLP